jgi:hypothetical protein
LDDSCKSGEANAVLYADRLHVAAGENYVLANIAESAAYRGRVVDQGHTRDKELKERSVVQNKHLLQRNTA